MYQMEIGFIWLLVFLQEYNYWSDKVNFIYQKRIVALSWLPSLAWQLFDTRGENILT